MKRITVLKVVCCIAVLITVSCSQNSIKQTNYEKWWLDPKTLPEWAVGGKLYCSRWDGGPIEAEKGQLSNWPYWVKGDPECVLKTEEDFYDQKTLEWAKHAGFNWLFLTWSNGFSHKTESKQWEILEPYIKKCHENGIHVSAYMSGANIFIQEMLKQEPESEGWWKLDSNGKPIRYDDLITTRYMANTLHPDWLPYQRVRIRKALEAGADGFWIDNIGTQVWKTSIKQLVDLIMEEGKRIGRTPLVNFNLHKGAFVLGRYMNSISTEDGVSPGIYSENSKEITDASPVTALEEKSDISLTDFLNKNDVSQNKPSSLVCNVGLLKYLYAVSEGWRPVGLENGTRDGISNRLTEYMNPGLWKLSLAECQMYNITQEPFVEGIFARDMFANNPKAFDCIDAMGIYNKFFKENQDYLVHPGSASNIGMIGQTEGDPNNERMLITYLDKLSTYNIQYDVLLGIDFSKARLEKYKSLVLMGWLNIDEVQSAILKQWVTNGGKLLVFGKRDQRTSMLQMILKDGLQPLGHGEIYFSEDSPYPKALSDQLISLTKEDQAVSVKAPWYLLHHIIKQEDKSRLIVHLLNYSQNVYSGTEITLNNDLPYKDTALLLSPDMKKPQLIKGTKDGNGKISFKLPEIKIYSMLVFTK